VETCYNLNMNICKKCGQEKLDTEMDTGREGRPNRSTCKTCRWKSQARWKKNHPKVGLVQWARRRAKVNNLPFNITIDDFEIPEFCPAIGVKLEVGIGKLHDFSPTLDRVIPELGYVKGNVVVISYLANRMKNNGTLEQLESLVTWLRSNTENTEATRENGESVTTNTQECPDSGHKIESELAGDCKRELAVKLATTA
jgi:hypothetical protein